MSARGTGCSTSVRPNGSSRRMNGTARSSTRLSLKSTRSAIRSPTAARTAATRATPSSVAPATLIFAVLKPRRSHSLASRAACSGATAPIHALSVTTSFTRPPSSECTGTPRARPLRSQSAISSAAFASKAPPSVASITASALRTLSASCQRIAGASRLTSSRISIVEASEYPGVGSTLPQPSSPSASVTRTRTLCWTLVVPWTPCTGARRGTWTTMGSIATMRIGPEHISRARARPEGHDAPAGRRRWVLPGSAGH